MEVLYASSEDDIHVEFTLQCLYFYPRLLKTVSHEEYEDPSNSNEKGNISFDTVVLLYRSAVERCQQRFLEGALGSSKLNRMIHQML
jgi:hypothetical protein